MFGKIALFVVLALAAAQAYPQSTKLTDITLDGGLIEQIKNVIHQIQESIKHFNETILKAINDFINQIKNSIHSAQESKIQQLIKDEINKNIETNSRRGIAACFEDHEPDMQQLAKDAGEEFKQCGINGLNVGKGLVDETKALIQQCLDLVTKTTMQFAKCVIDIIHYNQCFKDAIADAQKRAADIKTAGDQLGVDIKVKVEQGAEDFRVCWRGVYDFIFAGVTKITQDIEKCAGVE